MLRRLSAALVGVATVMAGLAAPAMAVTGGDPVPSGSGSYLVKVQLGDERACSGALVRPQWVLTVASCVAGDGGSLTTGRPPVAAKVVVGGAHAGSPARTLEVDRLVPHPDRDVALVRLVLPTQGIAQATVTSEAPTAGAASVMAGFGRTADTWVPDAAEYATGVVGEVSAATFAWASADGAAGACLGDAGAPVARTGGAALLGLVAGSNRARCLAEETTPAAATTVVRVDGLGGWVERNAPALSAQFGWEYRSTTAGIGGYDLSSAADKVVAFDYEHSGRADHLLMYRPGSKVLQVVRRNVDGTYARVFQSTTGLGDWVLDNPVDKIIAFDLEGSGKPDDLLVYRVGVGSAEVPNYAVFSRDAAGQFVRKHEGAWGQVRNNPEAQVVAIDHDGTGRMDDLLQYDPSSGGTAAVVNPRTWGYALPHATSLGGWTFGAGDRVVPFDREHDGKTDDLFVYRPGTASKYAVLGRNASGAYVTVDAATWTSLENAADQVVAMDYDHDGLDDDLVAYRPVSGDFGRVSAITWDAATDTYTPLTGPRDGGLGGFDLANAADRLVPFEGPGTGSRTLVLGYRPGAKSAWAIKRLDRGESQYELAHESSAGLAGFDLSGAGDRAIAYDFDHSGRADHVLLYRPGGRLVVIAERNADGTYTQVHRGTGIGDWALDNAVDKVVAFDLEGDGKLDDLLVYRPGVGSADVRNVAVYSRDASGQFLKKYQNAWGLVLNGEDPQLAPVDFDGDGRLDEIMQYDPSAGGTAAVVAGPTFGYLMPHTTSLGGWTFAAGDRVTPFDADHDGKPNDLLVYRPGTAKKYSVVSRDTTSAYTKQSEGTWPALGSTTSRVVATAYDDDGKLDDLVAYAPGTTMAAIRTATATGFTESRPDQAGGLGGFSLRSAQDQLVSVDAAGGGKAHLFGYRPAQKVAVVLDRTRKPDPAVTVSRPAGESSLVERFAYPDAERIGALLGIELVSGDGHIVVDVECATVPDDENVGAMRVRYTVESGGARTLCLVVRGDSGRIDLRVQNVFSLRGDGYEIGAGHDYTAVVDTPSGEPVTITGEPDTYTPVGIGADPGSEQTVLLQITV
ncbi:trypsin-like serine protease [Promicromonospora sp. NPDC057138]|uniref:trypsin-like serine protease n=1 Tax=Promicromonospora sp. NPDC057138 TaxID=3346031 RepID=UPI00363B6E68